MFFFNEGFPYCLNQRFEQGHLCQLAVPVHVEVVEHLLRHPLDVLDDDLVLGGLQVLVAGRGEHPHKHRLHLVHCHGAFRKIF